LTHPLNYFQLFGLPLAYALDADELMRRYRELQKTAHPDRYAHGGESERLMAVSEAARINDAFQTLRDPVKRARYLLELHGGEWQNEQTLADTAFLMEQIELREALEEAVDAHDVDALEQFCDQVKQQEKKQEALLEQEFSNLSALQLAQAKKSIQKLMFFRKLRDEAGAALNTAFDAL